MAVGKRQECEALAATHGVGTVRRLHRGRAYDRLAIVWRLQYRLLIVFLVLGLLGAWFGPVAAIVGGVGGLGALFVHSYLMPVGRQQGRRWVALCDDGLVTVSQHGASAAVHWNAVRSTQHLPKRTDHVQLGTVSSGTRYPEAYQVNATTTDDRQVELVLRDFGRQVGLVRAIEERVTPHVLERARRDLERTGHAAFGPIIVTPTRLIATIEGSSFDVPFGHVGYIGSRILSNQRTADPRIPILSGLPTSRALQELVASLTPTHPTGDARPTL